MHVRRVKKEGFIGVLEENRSIQQPMRYPAKKVRCCIPKPARSVALAMALFLFKGMAANEDEAVRAITAALRAKRYQEAWDLSRSAVGRFPKDERILVLESMALSGLHKDQEALAVLQRTLEIAPNYVPALEAAAEIEYRQGKPEAEAHLLRLLELHPGEPTAHAMLGALAWKQSDCSGAVQHFAQAKSAIAAQPDALLEFGACLMKMKRPEEAAGVYRQLAALRPQDRRALYALAVSLMDASRFRDAIAALEPLWQARSPDAVALELASNAHEALGETPQAVAELRQAVLIDPRNVNLYLDFAALAFTHQSFQVGIDMVNAGLTQIADSASLYLARGVLYVQLAEYSKADADFDKAERLDPNRTVSSVARGLSEMQQNNLDQALATVHAQLKANPNDAFLHYVLAELLSRQGAQAGSPEYQKAIEAAQEAVRLKADLVLARDVLSRLYLQSGEVDKAIEQCRLALRDDPLDEMALYRLIRALQSSGRPDRATEVQTLLKRFAAVREEGRKRQMQETRYRLVEANPAGARE
jgi:tetratricopeptide (TPR) repeat protein